MKSQGKLEERFFNDTLTFLTRVYKSEENFFYRKCNFLVDNGNNYHEKVITQKLFLWEDNSCH